MAADVSRPRYFVRNPNGETCWAYCGDQSDHAALVKAFGNFVVGEVDGVLTEANGEAVVMEFEVKMKLMTDAEVAALPDM